MIDNINPFKNLILLSKQLSDIRLQKDYLLQCEKNNALIDELSKEIKALVIVQNELKNDREKFIKKDKTFLLPIEKIDSDLELLKNQKSMIVENMDLIDFCLDLEF
ncbi:hypothetical protein N5U36_09315 [Aliarcobacter butzleri]|uniref:hypothetical protein n=1 Tax=Aliarcobacter butzleri TaxID=28197 RepID=UPI0021B39375|nr:hypothetical protein [Aliarcobacter butzleri]MCT7635652.1 hypothetical protein [Aliarcobacter butzleri]